MTTGEFHPDWADDAMKSYTLAISCMRERLVRAGEYSPTNETERRWAAEGLRGLRDLDTVRGRI